jgi:serine/threonine-protein kinase
MIGQTIGKYRVIDRVGRGGMGTVFHAVDETLHRDVAIKILNPELNDPDVARRFRSEAITVAKLNHASVATVYELFEHDDRWLIVMEFVRGETLEALVERTGALPVERTVDLMTQALAGLAHAHSLGIIHRDLKPANLMVNEGGAVKVMDFGIARVTGGEQLTTAGYMMGTPAYMAPEQILGGDIDARADLYAMGVVLYRLVTAKLPFTANTPFAMAQSQVNTPPTPVLISREGLPRWVDQVVMRALAKRPEERFQTAEEFAVALQRGLAGVPIDQSAALPRPSGFTTGALFASAAQQGRGQDSPAEAASKSWLTPWTPRHTLAAAAAVLVLVSAAVFFWPRASAPPQVSTAAFAVPQPSTPPPAAATPPPTPPTPVSPPSTTTSTSPAATSAPTPAGATPVVTSRAAAATSNESSKTTPAVPGRATPTTPATDPTAAGVTPSAPAGPRSGRGPLTNDSLLAFGDVRFLAVSGQSSKEQDVVLNFISGQITVVPKKGGEALHVLPYKDIVKGTYVHGNAPLWDSTAASPPDKLEVPGGFLKIGGRARNWLTLQTKTSFLILRLDDDNQRQVMQALESRAGITIDRRPSTDK